MTPNGANLISVQVRLDQKLLDRIDTHRNKFSIQPSRSRTIRFLLESAMQDLENIDPEMEVR